MVLKSEFEWARNQSLNIIKPYTNFDVADLWWTNHSVYRNGKRSMATMFSGPHLCSMDYHPCLKPPPLKSSPKTAHHRHRHLRSYLRNKSSPKDHFFLPIHHLLLFFCPLLPLIGCPPFKLHQQQPVTSAFPSSLETRLPHPSSGQSPFFIFLVSSPYGHCHKHRRSPPILSITVFISIGSRLYPRWPLEMPCRCFLIAQPSPPSKSLPSFATVRSSLQSITDQERILGPIKGWIWLGVIFGIKDSIWKLDMLRPPEDRRNHRSSH